MTNILKSILRCPALVLAILFAFAAQAFAQPHGTVEHITVHGKLLEGNLLGDTPDRQVYVYLPPSYAAQPGRRYPVVYLLHGFTDSPRNWFGEETKNDKPWINLPQIADRVFAADPAHEMILVLPNANNKFKGSFYSSSVTTGDWEDYIATELVAYMDQHYRTLDRPESRAACWWARRHPATARRPPRGSRPRINCEARISSLLLRFHGLPPGRRIQSIRPSISTCRPGTASRALRSP